LQLGALNWFGIDDDDTPRSGDAPRAAAVRGGNGVGGYIRLSRQNGLFAIVLCIAAVTLNNVLNFSVGALQLPLYVDMVGTAFASFAFGPWVGALVGVLTTLLGNLMHGDFTGTGFTLVQMVGAVVWGAGFRGWFGKTIWRFTLLNIVTAIACSAVAVPIILLSFGGVSTLSGVSDLGRWFGQFGLGVLGSLASENVVLSIVDKLLAGFVALGALVVLSRRGFVPSRLVRERLGMLASRAKR